MTISVCIAWTAPFDLAGGDLVTQGSPAAAALSRTLQSLRAGNRPPREVIVAVPCDARLRLPQASFPIRKLRMPDDTSPTAIRNALAQEAQGDVLVFLDPQCMVTPTTLDDYATAFARGLRGIVAGELGFLPPDADGAAVDGMQQHPDRPAVPMGPIDLSGEAAGVWGMNWAVKEAELASLGGFDEGYATLSVGEADLARRAAERGMGPRWIAGAGALHQYRSRAVPPLAQIDALLADAAQFHARWGEPAPERWLRAFALMGLIAPAKPGEQQPGQWRKLREPSDADEAMINPPDGQWWPGSAQLVQWLEDRAVVRLDTRGNRPGSGTAA
ncbi:glycosyltransferase family A protein [Croceibacterium sp. TMG7-5b_MA50]|uniref:glycosyltransferase family 2 protein n=1 Tax=Croceibacterium sp. TMG7-5b_MA50 TaxID=3121290 RepID=UPI0032218EEC